MDLDNDIVHMGRAEDLYISTEGDGDEDDGNNVMTIEAPDRKMLTKLSSKLVEFGGCIHKTPPADNSPSYGDLLRSFGVAYPQNEHLVPIESLMDLSQGGSGISVVHKDSSTNVLKGVSSSKRQASVFGFMKKTSTTDSGGSPEIITAGVTRNVNTSGSQEFCTKVISFEHQSGNQNASVFDPLNNTPGQGAPATDNFNAQELRFAFLRFFVALFNGYEDFFEYPPEPSLPVETNIVSTLSTVAMTAEQASVRYLHLLFQRLINQFDLRHDHDLKRKSLYL